MTLVYLKIMLILNREYEFKNLMMWGVIVLLVVGLFQLFQNPKNSIVSDKMPFSEFLKNIDDGRVVQVEIKGNDIQGILADGTDF